jgi:hypothetical protein
VKSTGAAGDSLNDQASVFINENGHGENDE